MNALINIEFRGDTLFAVQQDGNTYVAIKPICETLGIDWGKQKVRIKRDPILAEGGTVMVLPSLGGPQETTLLRLDLVNGWLFTIDESRVKDEEIRQRVLVYKRECYQVLYEHFHQPRKPVMPDIDQDAPLMARIEAVKTVARLWGKAQAREFWATLGLPPMPDMAPLPPDNAAEECLRHLLEYQPGRHSLRQMITEASAGSFDADLRPYGIRLSGDGDGFVVASSHPALLEIYAGSRWHGGGWSRALRQLSGASTVGTMNYGKTTPVSRGTFIPFGWVTDLERGTGGSRPASTNAVH